MSNDFCDLLILVKLLISKIFFQEYNQSANRLDSDYVRHLIGPGLGLNCLHRLSTDDISR